MKRWSIDSFGLDRLSLRDLPTPTAGAGEVLVRVANVSLNWRDLYILEGNVGPREFPFVSCSDLAGTVVACGNGVTRFAVGDRVISAVFPPGQIDGRPRNTPLAPNEQAIGGPNPGVLAEYVALSEQLFVKSPTTLSDAEASTLPIAGVTAWYSLVEAGRLRAGETVVVQGTGGVALFALQIAHALGARVIVTSGDDRKLERAKALGAHLGINRLKEQWAPAVLEATQGNGAEHIIEIAGGKELALSAEAAAHGGHIAVVGVLGGADIVVPATLLLPKQLMVRGIFSGTRRSAEEFVLAVDTLGLKPVIDEHYPFDEVPKAFKHLERGAFGKIVIDVSA